MRTDLLGFWTKDGLSMSGLLFRSKPKNKIVIIDIFGMTGSFFSAFRMAEELCRTAVGTNVDIFRAGNRGLGSVFPFRDKKNKRIFIGTAMERFEDCVYDIDAAVKLMQSLGYKKIILSGHSTGCQKATYYLYKTRSKAVKGLVLLAPMDDYNNTRIALGKKRFAQAVAVAKRMMKKNPDEMTPSWISHYSAARFLSYALPSSAEAGVFNYDSKLKEFGTIRCPIFVVVGSKDEYRTKIAKKHIEILRKATTSKSFNSLVINGADHGFDKKERELARAVINWSKKIA